MDSAMPISTSWEPSWGGSVRPAQRGDMSALIAHDMAFHRWVVERTGDPDLVAIWLTITVRMRLRYTRHSNLWECYSEHEAIVDAIRRRDVPTAIRGLEANIQ